MTSERFILNPFQLDTDKLNNFNNRLYKTGDLVRRFNDGSLEYIGRNDSQVKIRGFRIELGEIEAKISTYPGVKHAVAILYNNNVNKCIVGYYVSEVRLDEEDIVKFLNQKLPYYMIPQLLVHIDDIPLTINGKIDKRALPKPEFDSHSFYKAPKSYLEHTLVNIWAEILNLPVSNIGTTDSFFKLGGNSLLLMQLKNRLNEIDEFKAISIADLFKYTTIEQLEEFTHSTFLEQPFKLISGVTHSDTDIAIISMSGAFSGCKNLEEYWTLLKDGKVGVKHHTLQECEELKVANHFLNNPDFIPYSGHIPDIDKFDASFWDLAPMDAKIIDPQIRKFVEHAWFSLEESGYINLSSELNIGVFASCGNNKYLNNILNDSDIQAVSKWEAIIN